MDAARRGAAGGDAACNEQEARACSRSSSSSGRKRWRGSCASRRSCTIRAAERHGRASEQRRRSIRGEASDMAVSSGGWQSLARLPVALDLRRREGSIPEIAYENAINSMIEKYSQLKKATAAIIRRREDVDERLDSRHKELAQTDGRSRRRRRDQPGRPGGRAHPEEEPARPRSRRAEGRARHGAEGRRLAPRRRSWRAERDQEAQGREGLDARQDGSRRRRASASRSSSRALGRRRGQGARQRARAHQEHDRRGEPRRGARGDRRSTRGSRRCAASRATCTAQAAARRAEGRGRGEEGRAAGRCKTHASARPSASRKRSS